MSVVEALATALVAAGTAVMLLGVVALLRLPDGASRLHALTKADHVGLGLLVAGLALLSGDPLTALLGVVIWGLVLLTGASAAQLLADSTGSAAVQADSRAGRADTECGHGG